MVALSRVFGSLLYEDRRSSSTKRWEGYFALGAWCYSALLGLFGLLTLLRSANSDLHLLVVATTVGYAAGISARNAGRPTIALGQLGLSLVPIMLGLLLRPSPTGWVLACVILLFICAMRGISLKTYDVILAAFVAAVEKADVAERETKLARQDDLTGLANRMAFREKFELSLAERECRRLSIHWFDLDRFKEVNDTYGHMAGNALLSEMGRRLTATFIGTNSLAARFGGDEFVIMTQFDNDADPDAIARLVLNMVGQPFEFGGNRLTVTASVGVAIATDDSASSDALLTKADLALYRAKANGGNTACVYQPAIDELIQRRRLLEKELRFALHRGELEILYQPISDLATNQIVSCEALLRWHSQSLGTIAPAEFIPIAEETGLIVPIGEWVLREACCQASHWPENIRLAVNVSGVQLRDHAFPTSIASALDASGLAAELLELEVTETVLLEHDEDTITVLKLINEGGVRTTLDDFGTGFSSLSYLAKYPFQTLKIDRCFVADLDHNPASMAIIQTIVELAVTLGLNTVAEGVETPAQFEQIARARCSAAQGFLLARPMSADDLVAKLKNGCQAPHDRRLLSGSRSRALA